MTGLIFDLAVVDSTHSKLPTDAYVCLSFDTQYDFVEMDQKQSAHYSQADGRTAKIHIVAIDEASTSRVITCFITLGSPQRGQVHQNAPSKRHTTNDLDKILPLSAPR